MYYLPDNISFRTQTITVEKLLEGIRGLHIVDSSIRNNVEYPQCSEYIESVMMGLPLLPIIMDGSRVPWSILDGKKRLSVILGFANNVFCLNTGYTENESNPLNLNNWQFYVVPTFVINEKCGENKTISLGRIQSLGFDAKRYDEIKGAVDLIIDTMEQSK